MEILINHGGPQLSNTNRTIQLMARKLPIGKVPCSILLPQCNRRNHLSSSRNSPNNSPSSKILPLLIRIFKRFHTNTMATEDTIRMRAPATTTTTTRVRPIRTLLRTCPAVVAPVATTPSNITYSIYSKAKASIRFRSSNNNPSNHSSPNSNSNRMFPLMVISCTIDTR